VPEISFWPTGWKHAGENLAEVLKQRTRELPPPIQMSDALSRNSPKVEGVEPLQANCLAHGRRQVVEVADNFPEECRYVLETLRDVYHHDAQAREQAMSPEQRLRFHQERSEPLMKGLHEQDRAELRTGQAISYLLNHWTKLALFLRQAGAPIDNNIVERALKKAILNRKNALFYKTLNGAGVGDLFMSLIHTCELNGANPFDYVTELLRHSAELKQRPWEWMHWNYRETLGRLATPAAAQYDESCLAEKDHQRPSGRDAAKWPPNGSPATQNRQGFLASTETVEGASGFVTAFTTGERAQAAEATCRRQVPQGIS